MMMTFFVGNRAQAIFPIRRLIAFPTDPPLADEDDTMIDIDRQKSLKNS
jgi:hypothetical protein